MTRPNPPALKLQFLHRWEEGKRITKFLAICNQYRVKVLHPFLPQRRMVKQQGKVMIVCTLAPKLLRCTSPLHLFLGRWVNRLFLWALVHPKGGQSHSPMTEDVFVFGIFWRKGNKYIILRTFYCSAAYQFWKRTMRFWHLRKTLWKTVITPSFHLSSVPRELRVMFD